MLGKVRAFLAISAVAVALVIPPAARTQNPAQLLKDVGTGPGNATNTGAQSAIVEINGAVVYFDYDQHGVELWRSNGTAAGTYLVKDICPGICRSPSNFGTAMVKAGSYVYFVASDGSTGFELWKTDGTTAGTTLVKDIFPGVEASIFQIHSLTAVGARLFFIASSPATGQELWTSDGTETGTVALEVSPGPADSSFSSGFAPWAAELNGFFYFLAISGSYGPPNQLWRTPIDGTGSPMQVTTLPGGATSCTTNVLSYPVRSGSLLFFCAQDSPSGAELWRSDGTAGGTFQVADINPGPASSSPSNLVDLAGTIYFGAIDGASGRELWKSTGVPGNATMVMDINPGPNSSIVSIFKVGSNLFLDADDGLHGRELWVSNGLTSGTSLVQDIRPGPAGSLTFPVMFADVGGVLYFAANDGLTGIELWRSTESPGGATRLTDANPGLGDSQTRSMVGFSAGILFFAYDGSSFGLWETDGTLPATLLFSTQTSLNAESSPHSFTDVNGTIFFVAYEGGLGLWRSDGLGSNTVRVKDFSGSNSIRLLTAMNGALYFVLDDGIHGEELWRSDGTELGTSIVLDINSGTASSMIRWIEVLNNNQLIFPAYDGSSGFETWSSTGTGLGTIPLGDVCPGACPFNPGNERIVFGNKVYFNADDGIHGAELWSTDGTPMGTSFVADINPGPASTEISNFTSLNGTLFFTTSIPGPPYVPLWKWDGVTAGPVDSNPSYESPEHIFVANDLLLFFAWQPGTGMELWRSDSTAAGTALVKEIVPGPGEPMFRPYDPDSDFFEIRSYFVSGGQNLFFTLNDGLTGFELWKSDGTEAGTFLVKDIVPGPAGSAPRGLSMVDGILLFAAGDEAHGNELWRSDGTASGTFMLQDITPGPRGSFPRTDLSNGPYFVASGTKIYFAADDGTVGIEPWVMDRAAIQINTLTGSGVPVEPVDTASGDAPVDLTFGSVTQAGVTTLTTSGGGQPPPVGFSLGSPATYYEITTTAQFSGSVSVCIDYTGVIYADESQLKLFHLEGGSWIDRTTSLDMANDIICGQVTSFSPFLVLERVNQAPVARITAPASILVREANVYSGATSSDADGILSAFAWSFSDGTSASGPTVSHTFNASGNFVVGLTVTDDFGATASTTLAVHVMSESEAIASLASLVASFNLQQGIANSLDQKLQNVLEALNAANAGNRQDAANKLQSFINAVEAQRGKQLTSAQADQLSAAAQRILSVL